ncbi:MAG: hypothetical protein OXF08_05885 [Bacteroidetes bacterium]|nr:hypothetical protein [Bacteroidota bacterium]
MKRGRFFFAIWVIGCIGACSGPNASTPVDPDLKFGHRYIKESPDGEYIVSITKPDSETDYTYFPATFNHVIIRSDSITAERNAVPVEALVKGNFPDLCTELHRFDQKRAGNIITTTLEMRRPTSRVCANLIYPYQIYLTLSDEFIQGYYILKLNDRVIPFKVITADDE